MKKKYRQYNLENIKLPENTKQHLTAWLIDGLEIGWKVTLKDSENPEEYWLITGRGDTLIDKQELHNKSKWNNNI